MPGQPTAPACPCRGVSTNPEDYFLTRRRFLNRVGMGLGALGLATMLDPRELAGAGAASAADNPLAPRAPLDAWTKLARGLFQTGEAMFLN